MATQRACVFAPHALCDVRHTVRARARALLRCTRHALCAAHVVQSGAVDVTVSAHQLVLPTNHHISCAHGADVEQVTATVHVFAFTLIPVKSNSPSVTDSFNLKTPMVIYCRIRVPAAAVVTAAVVAAAVALAFASSAALRAMYSSCTF